MKWCNEPTPQILDLQDKNSKLEKLNTDYKKEVKSQSDTIKDLEGNLKKLKSDIKKLKQ